MKVDTFCISAVVAKSVQLGMCDFVLSHHQEYAALTIPACNRSALCDRETSSSHCPSAHLNNVIRLTESLFISIREEDYFFLCMCERKRDRACALKDTE